MTDSEWRTIETAPKCVEVLVQLSCGREAIAEYWPPPPIELDPNQECGGWAVCLLGSGTPHDLGMATEHGYPISWKPHPSPPPLPEPPQ